MALPERRATPREKLAVPLQMRDGRTAVTRDVSPAGMYVFIPPGTRARRWCALEFTSRQACVRIRMLGEVLRVERAFPSDGMAIRLSSVRITSLQ